MNQSRNSLKENVMIVSVPRRDHLSGYVKGTIVRIEFLSYSRDIIKETCSRPHVCKDEEPRKGS